MNELIDRLRLAAQTTYEWNPTTNPPLTDWAQLMEDAADALESYEEDEDEQ